MPDILPGFVYDRPSSRYRDTANGRFVARQRITGLLEYRVDSATERMGNIIQGVFAREIAPGAAQVMMRDELRRLTLSNAALGKGGIEQLTFRDYGRVGAQLRDSYQRMSNLLRDVEAGKVTLPQALHRIEGYALEARNQFFVAQREAQRASGRQFEERRILHARESCTDCLGYAAAGWQPQGTLPMIGDASKCGKYCRCTMESREVVEQPVAVPEREGMAAVFRSAPSMRPPSLPPGSSPPTPLAQPGGQPAGERVSRAMRVAPNTPITQAANDAIAAIDAVHGADDLLPVPVAPRTMRDDGLYQERNGRPAAIYINPTATEPRLTMVHEVGHMLDRQKLLISEELERLGWERVTSGGQSLLGVADQVRQWKAAIDSSFAVRELVRHALGAPKTALINGVVEVLPPDTRYVSYVLKYSELWARSYAQYVAVRHGDAALLAELAHRLNPNDYTSQWLDDDFGSIMQAIDAILFQQGWRK